MSVANPKSIAPLVIGVAMLLGSASATGARNGDPWAALHRPLQLKPLAAGAPCPVTRPRTIAHAPMALLGAGPVYPGLAAKRVTFSSYDRAPSWLAAKTIWAWRPALISRRTRVLVRGRRLDRPGLMRFQLGPEWGSAPITRELHLDTTQTVGSFSTSNWGTTVTMLLIRTPGCYGLQLDSERGTSTIIVDAAHS
jgi:hypothetical protein